MSKHNLMAYSRRGVDGTQKIVETKNPYSINFTKMKNDKLTRYCKGKDVLDMGCGLGYFAFNLAGHAKSVIGVDFSETILNKANKENMDKGHGVSFIIGNVSDLPLKEKGFDVAFCFATLYHVEDAESAINEMGRVLKDGGIAIFDFGNKYSMNTLLVRNTDVISYHISPSRMKNIIRGAGFDVKEHRAFQIIMWNSIPLISRFLERVVSRLVKRRMFDEIISSLPIVRFFAFRHVFVCRKVG